MGLLDAFSIVASRCLQASLCVGGFKNTNRLGAEGHLQSILSCEKCRTQSGKKIVQRRCG